MTMMRQRFKRAVAAISLIAAAQMAMSQDQSLDPLFDALREAEGDAARQIETKIWEEWADSGSASMNFLLNRGRAALESGETVQAIEHFTALIDHAPDFTEAYNARATAYFQAGRYGPSLADIREVMARNPRHFGALGGLAMILEEIGESAGALEAYRRVEELYPNREGLAEAITRLRREVEGDTI